MQSKHQTGRSDVWPTIELPERLNLKFFVFLLLKYRLHYVVVEGMNLWYDILYVNIPSLFNRV